MSLACGAVVGPYEVLERLAGGGMGEVYRARDLRLGREVALKVLPLELQADAALSARFTQEAQSASALNHRNIVTVYDVGEQGPLRYIAMELVSGRTFRELLVEGPLPGGKCIELAIQIVEGLAAAHERSVVHRDIKPENLMLTPDGVVKILDFGLARVTTPDRNDPATLSGAELATSPGTVLGTAGYMSPEQVRGRPAEATSDIFAFGCVLHEMATGRRAFLGESPVETMALILHGQPEIPPPGVELPAALARIIRRCLEKDPVHRPQSARGLAGDLRALASSPGSAAYPLLGEASGTGEARRTPRPANHADSVAVVPFQSAGVDAEYLADGITEQLINSLAAIPTLRVLPRSTMFRFKAREVDPVAVGQELRVRLVLTGRVMQRGDVLNVQAELLDVGLEAQVWGEQYARRLDDLFSVQREIAGQIADKLRFKLTGEQREALQRPHTEDPEAYRQYLKGRFYWNRRTAEGLQRAVVELRGAIERDPLYALAWAGLADAYNNLGSYCVVPPGDAFPKAKAAAVRALELDPARAEAHISIAFATQYFDWGWETAGREYRLGISLNDAYPTAHHWYGWYLICLGQLDAAERSMRRALELDPLSLPITTNLGFCMYFARRFSDAIAQFHRALELGGEFAEAHRGLGEAHEHLGELDVAVAHYRRALEFSGGSTEVMGALGRALAKAGHVDEAVQLLRELDQIRSKRYVSMHEQAMVRLGLGRLDDALQCLEQGIVERSYKSVYLRVDPDVDPLRNDPRFAKLLDAVGLTRLDPSLE